MAHLRKQIRDAAKAAIKVGVSAVADERVTGPRFYTRNLDGLPAIEVLTPESQEDTRTLDGVRQGEVALLVSIFAAGDDVDDALDAIAEDVEAALSSDTTLRALLDQFLSSATRFVEGDGGESKPARLDIQFDCVGKMQSAGS